MSLANRIRAYYQTLRDGGDLAGYFGAEPRPVKFGISETLEGYDAIERGLSAQTHTTEDWEVTSHRLATGTQGDVGWFSDHVTLRWHDRETDRHHEWDTRWSGTLIRNGGQWQFVRMHVSASNTL